MNDDFGAGKSQQATQSFEQVHYLCEAFANEWRAPSQGTEQEGSTTARPSLHSYVTQVAANARPTLFRNLLAIEVRERLAAGETPRADEYLQNFAQFAAVIRGFFEHLTHASPDDETLLTQALPSVPGQAPAVTRLGDFELLRELGRGGMGVVYEARHVKQGHRVALKTLPIAEGGALQRFKNEFRVLADINHPNLVGLRTLESDGCHWFFTMDRIEGTDFRSYVRPNGALDPARLRAALSQLVVGVMALHARHVIHRDLKPSNVMVTGDGQVILLDFGLIVELEEMSVPERRDEIAGTPRYMAPEASAGTITPASDWYSVGVMLYEALAGRAPFRGGSEEMLQAKLRREPPSLDHVADAPPDLAQLCLQLLARDRERRPSAEEIAKIVASGSELVHPRHTSSAKLVGRAHQLLALEEADRLQRERREPITVFISGRSGEGKTTLAEHFLQPLRDDPRRVVLSGRCYDRESVPFKALDSLIDALADYLKTLPSAAVEAVMPPEVAVLAQVFPVLEQIRANAAFESVTLDLQNERQVRQRAFQSFRALLGAIGERAPLLLFIDDLQWGDADSADVLFEVLCPPSAPVLTFLGTYRSDEVDSSPFLQRWSELKRKRNVDPNQMDLTVGPLSLEESSELVAALAGDENERMRSNVLSIAAETGGNPFLLSELISCYDSDLGSIRHLDVHEVVLGKLARLPGDARHLLDVVAVSGQALSLDEAYRSADHDVPPMETLTRMRNERMVRLIGSEERPLIDTYHDRIRESVLNRLDADARREIHRSLATVIEREAGGLPSPLIDAVENGKRDGEHEQAAVARVYDLAYHFDGAGESRKARIYATLAAEQARRQFALDVAVHQYAIARSNAEGSTPAFRYRIAEGCAETLMLQGRYDAANDQLDGVIELTTDPVEQARIEALQGEIAFKKGRIGASISIYERGIRRLGKWVPKSRLGYVCGLVWESAVQCVHSLFPNWLRRRAPDERSSLTIRLMDRLCYSYWFHNTLKMLWASTAGMNRAEKRPSRPQLAFNYAIHAVVMSVLGWYSRGLRYTERSIELRRAMRDQWGRGHSYCFKGVGLCAAARYEESLAALAEAVALLRSTGDPWERDLALFHTACCHFGLGNLSKAVDLTRETFEAGLAIGEDAIAHSALNLWAAATSGDLPFLELKQRLQAIPDDVQATALLQMAEGHWHRFHGRTRESLALFESAYDMARRNLVVNFHTMRALPQLVTALRLRADDPVGVDSFESQHLRLRALRLAKRSAKLCTFFPTDRPHSLRELGILLAEHGQPWEGIRYLDESRIVAGEQAARYEEAASTLARGKLALQMGLPEGKEQVESAQRLMRQLQMQSN